MNHKDLAERIIGSMVSCSTPKLSPDGLHVAFVVSRVDLEANAYRSQVWLARTDGSDTPRPVSAGERGGSPAWSPDGRALAFVSGRAEKKSDSTLHLLPVEAPGEVLTLATMPDGLGDVAFSPDGRWIAFTSRTQDERYRAKDVSWQAPRKIERFMTRLNGEDWVFDRPQHVYLVASDGSIGPRNLTPGEFQHGEFAWLPDSAALVVSAARHDTWDTDFGAALYRVPLNGRITQLTGTDLALGLPSVSPDGSTIAFIGLAHPALSLQNAHVGLARRTGADLRWISRRLDRNFAPYPGAQPAVWESATTLLGTVEDHGMVHLYRIFTDGAEPQALTSGPISVGGFDHAGGVTVVVTGAVDRMYDVHVVDGARLRPLTHFADRYADVVKVRTWEKFSVPCTDGTDEIDAWIMRPTGFDAKKKYPVLLNVHGGPFTQYGERFFDEAQMQAAAGFVVLMSNPRGGSGRTDQWAQCINGPKHPIAAGTGWGSVDVDDVNAVVDTALKRYKFCDAKRVGMLGGSYGGFMATWLAGTTGRKFKGICSERAVNNMLTEDFTSDISTTFRTEIGPSPLEDREVYETWSPIRFVREIDTPMLLIHSEEDWRCPINQAEELFVSLRLLGKEVTFYRFPGENHELSRSGSPVHRVQRAQIILDWFAATLRR